MAYDTFGTEGTAIVAVPGIGDTRASYRVLGPLLAEAGYRVIVMDLRGHGESVAGLASYTAEDIGVDVVALLDALDLRDAVLMGSSVGAAAIVHASMTSDRVARLVLLSGFVSDPPNFKWMRPLLGVMFVWPWGVWLWGMYRKTLFKRVEPQNEHPEFAPIAQDLLDLFARPFGQIGVGAEGLVHAIRGFRAAIHGFVLLESGGQFQMRESTEDSCRWLIGAVIGGLHAPD